MWRAISVFRWTALVWLIISASIEPKLQPRPSVLALLTVVTGWTLWISRGDGPLRRPVVIVDVTIGFGLNLSTGWLAPDAGVPMVPAFGLVYSYAAVFSAGASLGPLVGSVAGGLMGLSYLLGWVLNGVSLDGADLRQLLMGSAGLLAAGLVLGVVSYLLSRLSRATAEAIEEGRRAARLAERDSMARQIHDSVLQVLALIHKKGTALAESPSPSRDGIAELAALARDQEVALRGLFLRSEPRAPAGEASLRSALEAVVSGVQGIDVEVSAVGPVWMRKRAMTELIAAVQEAVANVVEHSCASRATVFADEVDGEVQVTVRDNGSGFDFDEAEFLSRAKFGILNSMRGRVEAIGGRMIIETSKGHGTEVEFRVPARPAGVGEVQRLARR